MDANGSGDDGLIEEHVDLEDDSINFWATLGVSPHVHVPVGDHDSQIQDADHIDHHSLALVDNNSNSNSNSRRDLFETENDQRLEPYLGMEFDSGEAAKTFYIAYAGRIGFCVRIARSRRSKCNETVIMLRFVCSREGWSREKRIMEGKKTRKRAASIREGCRAMLEVIRKGDGRWIVTKLVKDHNHEVGMPSRVHYIATEGDGAMEPYLGMEFESLEMARTFYYAYASRVGFEARVRQSRRSLHDESLKMLKLVCSKHRYHSGRENSFDSTPQDQILSPPPSSSSSGCEALFEIIRRDGGKFVVSKLVLVHNHELSPSPPSRVRCVRSQGEILVIAKNLSDTRNLLLNRQESSSFPREIRYNDLGQDDAHNLLEHMRKTQSENPAFFFSVQLEHGFMANIVWADAASRMAYHYFGDAVIFDTSIFAEKTLIPVVAFTGANHHLQPVVFGCALLVDDSEASFTWIFEHWLSAMSGRAPISLLTDLNAAIAAAASKVFPSTRHRFSKNSVIARIRDEIAEISSDQDLDELFDSSKPFDSSWETFISRYHLQNNVFLQSLYSYRHHWAPAFFKDAFFPTAPPPESVIRAAGDKFLTAKTQLRAAFRHLTQSLSSRHEKEAQADFETLYNKPFLKTASPMEKQAAGIYTKTVFNLFQEEFVESLGYHVDKIEDGGGPMNKYLVAKSGGAAVVVTVNAAANKASCSCSLFECSGMLCRHILRVFIVVGMRAIPKEYILKRWTKNAKSDVVSEECRELCRDEDPSAARYEELCRDAAKCAREGACSVEFFRVAKEALQKAAAEVVGAKQKKEQMALQNFIKSQRSRKQGKGTAAGSTAGSQRRTVKKRVAGKMDGSSMEVNEDSDMDKKDALMEVGFPSAAHT